MFENSWFRRKDRQIEDLQRQISSITAAMGGVYLMDWHGREKIPLRDGMELLADNLGIEFYKDLPAIPRKGWAYRSKPRMPED